MVSKFHNMQKISAGKLELMMRNDERDRKEGKEGEKSAVAFFLKKAFAFCFFFRNCVHLLPL